MEKIVLNNCPFCNGKARVYKAFNLVSTYYVGCPKCGAKQPSVIVKKDFSDKEAIQEVIDKWNNPATE